MENEPTIHIDGAKVRSLREQQNLTQLYMATVVDVTTDTISRWENKRYPSIKRENALKLAEALGVPLEDLLEEETPVVCVKEDSPPVSTVVPHTSSLLRHRLILLGVCCLMLLGVTVWMLLPAPESLGIQSMRYLPTQVLPGQPFPVLVKVDTRGDVTSSFLLRESLPEQCSARQAVPAFLTQDTRGHQIKWISTMERKGAGTFFYLVDFQEDVEIGTLLNFSGTIVMGQRGSNEPSVLGAGQTTVTSFHWADENHDNRIDDYEMLSVYELFPEHRALGIDIKEIEAIWACPGYRWNGDLGRIELLGKSGASPHPGSKISTNERSEP